MLIQLDKPKCNVNNCKYKKSKLLKEYNYKNPWKNGRLTIIKYMYMNVTMIYSFGSFGYDNNATFLGLGA